MRSSQRGITDETFCPTTVYSPIVKYSAKSLYREVCMSIIKKAKNILVQTYSETAKDSTKRV
jgi:hypothetical protein